MKTITYIGIPVTIKLLDTYAMVLEKAKPLLASSYWMKEKFYSTWGSTETDLVYLYLIHGEELQKNELELLETLNELYSAVKTNESRNAVIQGQPENIEAAMNMGLEDLQDKWDGNP